MHCRTYCLSALAVLCTTGLATAQWVQRTPSVAPSARGSHVLEYDVVRSRAVLFGGYPGFLNDTWEWDGNTWAQRFPAHSPPGRDGAANGFDLSRQRVVVFGGRRGSTNLADTWEWDGNDWLQAATGTAPPARILAGMAFDTVNNRLLLFGGGDGQASVNPMADTWTYDGVNWTQLHPAHAPAPRWGFGMTADFASGSVLLQGGSQNYAPQSASFNDTWRWDG
jgi:hypothetical protein